MRRALRLHPDGDRGPVVRIEAAISRPAPRVLALSYELAGRTGDLGIPSPAPPERTDGLWRGTCFEAFVGLGDGPGYLEFNLSPSGQWAAYRFEGYRAGMAPLELPPPDVTLARTGDALILKARLDLSGVADLAPDRPWRLGLSAVIEEAGGRIAYWALAHAPGKPDFHHADGFACLAPAPEDA